MKIIRYGIFMLLAMIIWTSTAYAQPMEASQSTEVIGRLCKTMEKHPASTAEVNFNILDYAVCGPGGLRVYPKDSVSSEFNKIKFGVQGKKTGKEVVYLHGYMRTKVMPAFGEEGTDNWRPRFRFSWLEVDQIKRGISLIGKPNISRNGDLVSISVEISNPLNKAISGTQAVLNLEGSEYLEPITKMVPTIGPGGSQTVQFDVPAGGKIKGQVLIKNYGRIYIDIVQKI